MFVLTLLYMIEYYGECLCIFICICAYIEGMETIIITVVVGLKHEFDPN